MVWFTRNDRLRGDAIIYRPNDVVVGRLRLAGTTLRRAIATEEIHRVDDALLQSSTGDGVQSVASLDVARDSLIAIGGSGRLEGPLPSGTLVQAGPYLVYGRRRRRPSLGRASVVAFDRAVVGHRAGSFWRQESVAPLYVIAEHITLATPASRPEFEAATAVRRVAQAVAGIGTPSRDRRASEKVRDPYWDLDGDSVRNGRRNQRVVRALVVVLSGLILGLTLLQLRAVDAPTLIHGPSRPVVFTALAADTLAAALVFAHQVRRRLRYTALLYGFVA